MARARNVPKRAQTWRRGAGAGVLLGAVALALWGVVSIAPAAGSHDDLSTRQFGTGGNDIAHGVSADPSGNVYMAGYTYGALPGQTSLGQQDAFVRKHGPAGDELWTSQFGTGSGDFAYGVSADPSGNVYVAGYTYGALPGQTALGQQDPFVRKYGPAGDELWTRQFGTGGDDHAYGVSADPSGNVYVAGWATGTLPGQTSSGGRDGFVRKYGPVGDELWTRQFGAGGWDQAHGVSADLSGNVYVTGYVTGALPGQTYSGGWDAFVRKYSPAGDELWTRQFGTGGDDQAFGVSADPSGNVYVAGYTVGALPGQTASGNWDVFVRKYSPAGDELWTRQFGTGVQDYANEVSADPSGNIYVAGITLGALPGQTSLGEYDAFVRKYGPAGDELWTRQFGTGSGDFAYGVSADPSGNVYVVGYTTGALPGQTALGGWDAFVRGYDSAGQAPNTPPAVTAGASRTPLYTHRTWTLQVATFTDPNAGDTHTASINWGDGTVTPGTVNESARTVTGSHRYDAAGAYTVTVTVTDNRNGSGQGAFQLVVRPHPRLR